MLAALLMAGTLLQARAHLKAGQLDQVLLDLLEPGARPAEEAAVLTDAAQQAKARQDEPLALQLAQKAMQRDPANTRPLRLLGEWSLSAREFGQAHRYGDLWLARAH